MTHSTRDEIILAALLHDIGKFAQRADSPTPGGRFDAMAHSICPKDPKTQKPTHIHALHTAAFFDTHCASAGLPRDVLDRVSTWACKHHAPDSDSPEQLILQAADWMSSGTDRLNADASAGAAPSRFRQTRLRSTFSTIHVQGAPPQPRYHDIAWLDPTNAECLYPDSIEAVSESLPRKYEALWERFLESHGRLRAVGLKQYLLALDSLLLHSTWCIPSSTIHEPDISLYDHSRTTAAIAAAMWDYHDETGTRTESAIRNMEEEKFILVGGDLSGIQRFIFNLSHSSSRGAAKILRARSFFLVALTMAVIRLIEEEAGLSPFATLMNAAGCFTLLAPNLPRVHEGLHRAREIIDRWLLGRYYGELAVHLNGDTRLARRDFEPERFSAKLEELSGNLDREKPRKWRSILQANGQWADTTDLLAADYGDYGEEVCPVAGVGPATVEAEGRRYSERTNEEIQLGRELTRAGDIYLVFGPGLPSANISFFDGRVDLHIQPAQAHLEAGEHRTYALNGYRPGFGSLYIANHVPRVTAQELEARRSDSDAEEEDFQEPGDPRNFEQIAKYGAGEKGAVFLGLLKADVDSLGVLTTQGFGGRRPLSRYVAFSRMLNFFFTARMPAMMRGRAGNRDFSNIYTVFAGGDDLFLISDWQTSIDFAQAIRQEFARYTGENPELHFSAALSLLKPRQPLRDGAERAEGELKRAKERDGKNAFRLFGDTVAWPDFGLLREFMQFLCDKVGDEGAKGFSIGFIRRLLAYHRLYRRSHLGGDNGQLDLGALIYRSHLRYDVARNIDDKPKLDANGRRTNPPRPEALEILSLLNDDPQSRKKMEHLRVPVMWALYQYRRR